MVGRKKNVEVVSKIRTYSNRCYPTLQNLIGMKTFVDGIQHATLRNLITTILCTGARVCEAINGYCFFDDFEAEKRKILFKCPIEKKFNITKWKRPEGKMEFLGSRYLEAQLNNNIWKTRRMINIFDLDVGWFTDNTSDDAFTPNWLFKGVRYKDMYAELKKIKKMKVKYYDDNKYDLGEAHYISYMPSFHFFRKSFCAELIRKNKMNVTQLARYIKWESLDMSMKYLKEVDEENERTNEDMRHVEKW